MNKDSEWVSRRTAAPRDETLPEFERIRDRRGSKGRRGVRRRKKRQLTAFGKKGLHHDRWVKWSVLAGAATLVMLALTISVWIARQAAKAPQAEAPRSRDTRATKPVSTPDASSCIQLVKTALAERDPARIADHFHLSASSPAEVIAYLNRNAIDPTELIHGWVGSIEAAALPVEAVSIRKMNPPFENHLALLWPDGEGRWKVDFAAYARLSEPGWDQILQPGPTRGRVRVVAIADSYYNGIFKDPQWICYRMVLPELDRWLYAYCRSDSLQARAMRAIQQKDPRMAVEESGGSDPGRRVILDIRRPEGAMDSQFEILSVVAEDWILQDTPFEETLKSR